MRGLVSAAISCLVTAVQYYNVQRARIGCSFIEIPLCSGAWVGCQPLSTGEPWFTILELLVACRGLVTHGMPADEHHYISCCLEQHCLLPCCLQGCTGKPRDTGLGARITTLLHCLLISRVHQDTTALQHPHIMILPLCAAAIGQRPRNGSPDRSQFMRSSIVTLVGWKFFICSRATCCFVGSCRARACCTLVLVAFTRVYVLLQRRLLAS